MGRGESAAISKTASANSAQDQANAQAALGSTNSAVTNYSNNLNNFMKFGRSVYGANGEYMKDQNALATTTAAAGANKLSGDLALNASRTGENTANYAPTEAESLRQSERDLTGQLASADANRLQQLTAINQYGVQASALPAQVYSNLYGTGTSGAGGQLNTAESASAASPGFWDVFGSDLASGGGAALGNLAK